MGMKTPTIFYYSLLRKIDWKIIWKLNYSVTNIWSDIFQFLITMELKYLIMNIWSDIGQYLTFIELEYKYSINMLSILFKYKKFLKTIMKIKLFYQFKIFSSLFEDILSNGKLQIGHFKNTSLICKKHSDTCSLNKYTMCGNTFSYFRLSFLFLLITARGVAQNAGSKEIKVHFLPISYIHTIKLMFAYQ